MRNIYSYLIVAILALVYSCAPTPHDVQKVDSLAEIFPDYVNVAVPADIAPLNFNVLGDDVEAVHVTVKGSDGNELLASGKGNLADFDIDEWHALLASNKGKSLTVTVCADIAGQWKEYKPFSVMVSKNTVDDYGLTYRRIAPGYEVYGKMGIYQRCLQDFEEEPIIENSFAPGACLNCHSANATNPDQFTFHVRGLNGATVVKDGENMDILKARSDSLGGSMVYPYWHPSGKYCAYSTNVTHQAFHSVANERIEVYDDASDVFVYNPRTREIIKDTLLFTQDHFETYPAFSSDGKTLYFVSALKKEIPSEYKEIRYDLCSIAFDAENGRYGDKVDTLFAASKQCKSVVMPRPSYDGRYLMFTIADYGCFPIWHKEADLWIMDLRTGVSRPISEVNSNDTESFHNWSGNSHWFVFSSRRGDGLYTCLYISSIDDQGKATKPFLLPQRNPQEYYQDLMFSYNCPDFTHTKVDFNAHDVGRKCLSDERKQVTVRNSK